MTILASASPGEVRVAAVRDGRLIDYAIERPAAPDHVGAILRGRVTARMPALAGAFVTLGGIGDGFLPDSAGGGDVTEGAILALRVTRAAQGGKGPRLIRLSDPPTSAPLGVISPGPDALTRLAALHPVAAIVVDDPALLAARRAAFGGRLSLAGRAFDDTTESEIQALAEPGCALPSGGTATIEPTSALVAIDVDLGRRQHSASLARPPPMPLRIPHFCQKSRARSGCGTCPARSWSTSPASRRGGARLSARPWRRRWPMIRCARASSGSRPWAWRKSCGRACIRRCTSYWGPPMPPDLPPCGNWRAI